MKKASDPRINQAIKDNNYEFLLEKIQDGNIFDFSYEDNFVIIDFLKKNMQKIQQKNNYSYVQLDEVKTFISQANVLLESIKSNPPKNIQEAEQYRIKALETLEISRKFFAKFTLNIDEFLRFFEEGKYISNKDRLLMRYAKDDKTINNPQIRCEYDEDGWPIEGSERLETPEEVKKRIKETLAKRDKELKNVKDNLSCNDLMNFCYNSEEILQLRTKLINCSKTLDQFLKEEKLENFKSDKEFYNALLEIMDHDKDEYTYLYHGTQSIEDAQSIVKTGLGMAVEDLDRTTYAEFTPEALLLYSRGMASEIGADAVVIIKQPKNVNIVQPIGDTKINFLQSGLGGFGNGPQYIIKPEHIVGFVNKRDHKIEYGQAFTNNKQRT